MLQDAVKDMLAIPKHNSIVLYGSDPPYHPVKDIFWLLNQPTISMNIYVSSIASDMASRQLRTFSFPAKLSAEKMFRCSSAPVASSDKISMDINVVGLEAALAKTRRLCNELSCDVTNSVKKLNSDNEVDQLLSLANSIVTNLQGNYCGAGKLYFLVEESSIKLLILIC